MLIPRELRLLDRDGTGVVAGDTRVVMMLREFIVGGNRKPWGIWAQKYSTVQQGTDEMPSVVG